MLVAALALSTVIVGAGDQGIAGFEKLRFGETQQQVAHDYPNFEEWSAPDINAFTGKGYERHYFGLQHHVAGGCVWSFEVEFSENRLVTARLNQRADDTEDCYEQTRKVLSDKYGPDYEVSKFGSDIISFKTGNGSVAIWRLPRKDGTAWSRITYIFTVPTDPRDYDAKRQF